ncbi:MAG: hypothetical protein A3K18_16450 [Lentisphaerae bacterium RIFOXYA12_64_32]|nr:MAG: hypothetical protein A3K18_16450 [Lentisphaerae bacterium RIFOXYA12_64_32]
MTHRTQHMAMKLNLALLGTVLALAPLSAPRADEADAGNNPPITTPTPPTTNMTLMSVASTAAAAAASVAGATPEQLGQAVARVVDRTAPEDAAPEELAQAAAEAVAEQFRLENRSALEIARAFLAAYLRMSELREFSRAADKAFDAAVELLLSMGVSPAQIGSILSTLAAEHGLDPVEYGARGIGLATALSILNAGGTAQAAADAAATAACSFALGAGASADVALFAGAAAAGRAATAAGQSPADAGAAAARAMRDILGGTDEQAITAAGTAAGRAAEAANVEIGEVGSAAAAAAAAAGGTPAQAGSAAAQAVTSAGGSAEQAITAAGLGAGSAANEQAAQVAGTAAGRVVAARGGTSAQAGAAAAEAILAATGNATLAIIAAGAGAAEVVIATGGDAASAGAAAGDAALAAGGNVTAAANAAAAGALAAHGNALDAGNAAGAAASKAGAAPAVVGQLAGAAAAAAGGSALVVGQVAGDAVTAAGGTAAEAGAASFAAVTAANGTPGDAWRAAGTAAAANVLRTGGTMQQAADAAAGAVTAAAGTANDVATAAARAVAEYYVSVGKNAAFVAARAAAEALARGADSATACAVAGEVAAQTVLGQNGTTESAALAAGVAARAAGGDDTAVARAAAAVVMGQGGTIQDAAAKAGQAISTSGGSPSAAGAAAATAVLDAGGTANDAALAAGVAAGNAAAGAGQTPAQAGAAAQAAALATGGDAATAAATAGAAAGNAAAAAGATPAAAGASARAAALAAGGNIETVANAAATAAAQVVINRNGSASEAAAAAGDAARQAGATSAQIGTVAEAAALAAGAREETARAAAGAVVGGQVAQDVYNANGTPEQARDAARDAAYTAVIAAGGTNSEAILAGAVAAGQVVLNLTGNRTDAAAAAAAAVTALGGGLGETVIACVDVANTAVVEQQQYWVLAIVSAHGNPRGAGVYPKNSWANWSVGSPTAGEAGVRYVTERCSGQVYMNANRTVTIQWAREHLFTSTPCAHGSVVAEITHWRMLGPEIESMLYYWTVRENLGEAWVHELTTPFVRAVPEPGYRFTHWSGDVPADRQQYANISLPADRPRTIQAHFDVTPPPPPPARYELTIVSDYDHPQGAGVYAAGTDAQWSVTSPWPGTEGQQFVADPASGTVRMTAPLTVTVNWTMQWRLTTAATNGTVDVQTGWHDDDSQVTLTATPATDFHFVQWTGDVPAGLDPTENPLQDVTMDQARNLTAQFLTSLNRLAVNGAVVAPWAQCGINSSPGWLTDLSLYGPETAVPATFDSIALVVNGAQTLDETFESGTAGAPPAGWTFDGTDAGAIRLTNTPVYAGDLALTVQGVADPAQAQGVYRAGTFNPSPSTVTVHVFVPTGQTPGQLVTALAYGGRCVSLVTDDVDGSTLDVFLGAQFADGTGTPVATGLACGEWHTLVLDLYSSQGATGDADGDTLSDWDEVNTYGTDPTDPDTDNDGLNDGLELTQGTNPLDDDSDSDGMPDGWEVTNVFDPLLATDATADSDNDGLTNLQEYTAGTDPHDADSDADGLVDGVETNTGVFVSVNDTGTDPLNEDTDGDGLLDGVETGTGVFVSVDDTGTSPIGQDTDGDGMPDGFELATGLNPTLDDAAADVDGDGFSNLLEYRLDTDPANAASVPALATLAGDLRGCWPLAADFTDTSHLHNHGTFGGLGQPVFADASLDLAAGGYVDCGNAESLYTPTTWTLSAWVKDAAAGAIAGRWDEASDMRACRLVFEPDGTGNATVSAELSDNGSWLHDNAQAVQSAQPVSPGEWTHIAVTWQAGELARIYVNGADVSAAADPDTAIANIFNTSAAFLIGAANGGAGSLFTGRIAQVTLFGTALSPTAVAELHTLGRTADLAPLLYQDSDADGMADWWERKYFGDLSRDGTADFDLDGLTDAREFELALDPATNDTDADGIQDGDEVNTYETNPRVADTDGDGLSDGAEILTYHTDPSVPDSDGDGMPDGWEVAHGLNPLLAADAAADPDHDGLTNLQEYANGTNPQVPDLGNARVSFTTAAITVSELAGQVTVTLQLNELPPYRNDVQATVNVTGGTATNGADYTFTPVNLTFDASHMTQTFTLDIHPDLLWDPDEQIVLSITDLAGAVPGDTPTLTITIDDDMDNDGMADYWEQMNGFDPNSGDDANADADGDGVSNLVEFLQGRNPHAGAVADPGTQVSLVVYTVLE